MATITIQLRFIAKKYREWADDDNKNAGRGHSEDPL